MSGFSDKSLKELTLLYQNKGYSMILVDTDESKEKEAEYLKMLFQQRIAGLVIATVNIDGINIDQYSKHNIPVAFIDNMPNLDKPFNAVLIDNVLASRYAVRHFLEKGHKDIAIITGSTKETTGYDRLLGYQLALKDANVEINDNLIMKGNYKEPSGYKCMKTAY